MISRSSAAYSSMIRRASSNRDDLSDGSSLPRGQFVRRPHATTVGKEPKGTIELDHAQPGPNSKQAA
jgi:hypothetical protein